MYANGLVKSEEEKTKRLVKGLNRKLGGKLIPLQLRSYLQAVEKALEVVMDIQESREDWVKELSVPKRPRYQGPSESVVPASTSNKGSGFDAAFRRGEWWLRNRNTFQGAQTTSMSYPRITRPLGVRSVRQTISETACRKGLIIIVEE